MYKFFDYFKIGDQFRSESRKISEESVIAFANVTGLDGRLHLDEEFAKTTMFGTRIVQGALVESVVGGLWFKMHLTDRSFIANLGHTTNHPAPTKIGDTLHLIVEVKNVRPSATKPDRGVLTVELDGRNQSDEVVCKMEIKLLIKRKVE